MRIGALRDSITKFIEQGDLLDSDEVVLEVEESEYTGIASVVMDEEGRLVIQAGDLIEEE